jgi:carboxyl-terminal processing protease
MKRTLKLIILAAWLVLPATAQKNHNFEVSKNLEIFNNLFKQLDLYYVDTLEADKLVKTATGSMLNTLDPYTEYYPDDERDDLKQMLTGKYAGIGSLIHYSKNEDRCIISEPFENMPAAEGGLKAGDVILSIAGKEFGPKGSQNTNEFTESVSNALRGEPGTSFIVKIQRPGEDKPREIKLTRRAIKTPPISYYGMIAENTGYIYLSSFPEGAATDVRRAVIDLKQKGAKQLVLDLRNNGGGSMQEAIDLVNLFIGKGKTVVELKGKIKSANETYKTQREALDPDIPLAVLVNGNTASSSEITAGTLQDYDRAVVIGTRTYGKGLVQQTRPLPYDGVLKLTTSRYYIPSGRCIQAIDYSHRAANGAVNRIPDSLTNVFHTAAGRPVRDGGGIMPDSVVKVDSVANIVLYLNPGMITSDVLFNFVTEYTHRHATIDPPEKFDISDEEYENFKRYAKEHNFTYDRQSVKLLDNLKKVAKFEGYDVAEDIKALEAKLTHNEDYDFEHWKPEIKKLLNNEIMLRYYYRRGLIRNSLNNDKTLDTALAVLNNPQEYRKMLAPQPGQAQDSKPSEKK